MYPCTVSARYCRLAFRGKQPKDIRRRLHLKIPALKRRRDVCPVSGDWTELTSVYQDILTCYERDKALSDRYSEKLEWLPLSSKVQILFLFQYLSVGM